MLIGGSCCIASWAISPDGIVYLKLLLQNFNLLLCSLTKFMETGAAGQCCALH